MKTYTVTLTVETDLPESKVAEIFHYTDWGLASLDVVNTCIREGE